MNEKEQSKYDSLCQPAENKQMLAYRKIKEDILNNTYPAGTVMVERKLCDIYEVSRSPIRNALQRLAHEGLLTFEPGKGMVVASFTPEDILEVYDLIELLQLYAVRACILKNSEILLDSLHLALDNMQKALQENNIYENKQWDSKFHELINNYSGNSRLINIYEQLDCQQMRFIATVLDDTLLAEASYRDHETILHAIEQKDIDAAQEAIRTHYTNIKQYYINKLIRRIHI